MWLMRAVGVWGLDATPQCVGRGQGVWVGLFPLSSLGSLPEPNFRGFVFPKSAERGCDVSGKE